MSTTWDEQLGSCKSFTIEWLQIISHNQTARSESKNDVVSLEAPKKETHQNDPVCSHPAHQISLQYVKNIEVYKLY